MNIPSSRSERTKLTAVERFAGPPGNSPAAQLLNKIRQLAYQQTLPGLVALVLPQHRATLFFHYGRMFTIHSLALTPVRKGLDGENAIDALQRLLDRYLPRTEIGGQDFVDLTKRVMKDSAATCGELETPFAKVNHAPLLRDTQRYREEWLGPNLGVAPYVPYGFYDLRIDGDRATVRVKHRTGPVRLSRRSGGWYLDLLSILP